jgi:hypothetical protein
VKIFIHPVIYPSICSCTEGLPVARTGQPHTVPDRMDRFPCAVSASPGSLQCKNPQQLNFSCHGHGCFMLAIRPKRLTGVQ